MAHLAGVRILRNTIIGGPVGLSTTPTSWGSGSSGGPAGVHQDLIARDSDRRVAAEGDWSHGIFDGHVAVGAPTTSGNMFVVGAAGTGGMSGERQF